MDSKISFVYFDVGGVVIDDFSGNNKRRELKAELGITAENDAAFEKLWSTYAPDLDSGQRDAEAVLTIIKKKFGLRLPDDYRLLDGFVNRFAANPEIWPIIEKVRKRAGIGLLTNMYPGMLEAIRHRNILPKVSWNAIVDSSVERIKKPDPKFFRLAEQRAKKAGQNILFIDNMRRNTDASIDFGWQAHLYDPTDHRGSCKRLSQFLTAQGLL